MNEFDLINAILRELGPVTSGENVCLGPGDDAAAIVVPEGQLLVSSIDSLIADVHFPADAPAPRVGYRALMVSLSDLAAMGAKCSHVLVSLTLDTPDPEWAVGLARGMRQAAEETGASLVGGNVTRGQRAVHVSVHGFAPPGKLLRRTGAQTGERIYVTGDLGGAAAALALPDLARRGAAEVLEPCVARYFQPQARLAAGIALRGVASSLIDVSDGLLQDLAHLCEASGVRGAIDSARVPVCAGATLEQALRGGDDYELLFTTAQSPPTLDVPVTAIGEILDGAGVVVDGKSVETTGYLHFS